MINTKRTAAAANLAQKVFGGEADRTGKPALEHYRVVAQSFDAEDEACVALLCDALDGGKVSEDDLRAVGLSDAALDACLVLRRGEAEEFFDYIIRIKGNGLAARVKRADLVQHVADMESYISLTGYDRRRRTSYLKAIDLIDGVDELAYDGLFESQHHHGQLKTPVPAAPKPPVQH